MGKIRKQSKFVIMAKAIKKKTAKTSSDLFHNIMAASVKGKPKKEDSKRITKK